MELAFFPQGLLLKLLHLQKTNHSELFLDSGLQNVAYYPLCQKLLIISEKELTNKALTDEEYEFIRTYGGSLEHLWIMAYEDRGISHFTQLSEEPAPVVADVASDPNGRVLEEGTGYIAEIYAVVPVDGKLRITKGGVYTHYEFPWPLSDRLTDEKWRELLRSEDAPEMAEWTKAFIAQ